MQKLIIIAIIILSTPAFAAWHENVRSTEQTATLATIEQLVSTTQHPVVIFDLDATLYKDFSRHAAIVREFGRVHGLTQLKGFLAEHITNPIDLETMLTKDAKLAPALVKRFASDFTKFWQERFFTNEYVQYDTPLPGASKYVRSLYSKGATIVYMTERDPKTMRRGTELSLKRDGFPLGKTRTVLIMKNTTEATAHAKSLGTIVAAFDNAPTTINRYKHDFHATGAGVAVFLDTNVEPGAPAVDAGVLSVRGFLR